MSDLPPDPARTPEDDDAFDVSAEGVRRPDASVVLSADEQTRQRATRALAELAYISCVVADTQQLTPEQVRERVQGSFETEQPPEPQAKRGKRR